MVCKSIFDGHLEIHNNIRMQATPDSLLAVARFADEPGRLRR
jgi:hypothetical protein